MPQRPPPEMPAQSCHTISWPITMRGTILTFIGTSLGMRCGGIQGDVLLSVKSGTGTLIWYVFRRWIDFETLLQK
uniref:Uncharacterized protein n=1 Tax=Arundo donax TaxID=35708 RepID=A0A0A9FPS5_ARUDO